MIKPTVEQVQAEWESQTDPSSRSVADALGARGFKISYRTVCRWHANNWLTDGRTGKRSIAENQHTPAGVKREIRAALQMMDTDDVAEANEIAANDGLGTAIIGDGMKDDDIERIAKRIQALAIEDKSALVDLQEKARIIMNIVLMEEATRKAHIMTLIPKDTGTFVHSFTEASKALAPMAPIEGIQPERNGNDAKLIEGKTIEASPLSMAIRNLREKATA